MLDCDKSNGGTEISRVAGVICEYDPFHNGHAYQLRALRARGFSHIVCAMSGHFTQRGNAAIISKWARAEMALRSGADIVFELPALFAVRDAERFARGGVSLLSSLSVVTHLGFGSESGDLDALHDAVTRAEDTCEIKKGLSRGETLARARGSLLGLPNDILGAEYLRAISALKSPLIPFAIKRIGSGYHDAALSDMPSATAVRAALFHGDDLSHAMPAPAHALLSRLVEAGYIHRRGALDTALLALLRTMPADSLREIADVGEGLENRILRAAQRAGTRAELLSEIKCKRYTHARLSRILTQTQLSITKELAASYPTPPYARLLGFRRDAAPLLHMISERATIPLITRPAKFSPESEALALDIRAGDLWTLGMKNAAARAGRLDLTQRVIIID